MFLSYLKFKFTGKELSKNYIILLIGRGGQPKNDDCIIDGGGGLETAKKG